MEIKEKDILVLRNLIVEKIIKCQWVLKNRDIDDIDKLSDSIDSYKSIYEVLNFNLSLKKQVKLSIAIKTMKLIRKKYREEQREQAEICEDAMSGFPF